MMIERLENRERELARDRQSAEAKRLGATAGLGLRARVDAWLIRAGSGAQRRQEQRSVSCTQNHQVTS